MSGLEAVGAVASAMQFAAYTYRALQVLRSLISDLRSAPQRIQRRATWLQSLIEILEYIELHQASMFPNVRQSIQDIYTQAVELQSTLVNSLRRIQIRSPKRYWRAAVFALAEERNIVDALSALEQDKSNLHLWISVVGSSQITQQTNRMSSSSIPHKVEKQSNRRRILSRVSRKRDEKKQDVTSGPSGKPRLNELPLQGTLSSSSLVDDVEDADEAAALVKSEQTLALADKEEKTTGYGDLTQLQDPVSPVTKPKVSQHSGSDDSVIYQDSFLGPSSTSSQRSTRSHPRRSRKPQANTRRPTTEATDVFEKISMNGHKRASIGPKFEYGEGIKMPHQRPYRYTGITTEKCEDIHVGPSFTPFSPCLSGEGASQQSKAGNT